LKAYDSLALKCWSRSGDLLGDLELADGAGEATIFADEQASEISISESGRYVMLLRRSSDLAARFAPPIVSERLGRADELLGVLATHVGLGAVSLGFNDAAGSPLWRRVVRIRPTKFKDAVEFETMVAEICAWRTALALDLQALSSAPWTLADIDDDRPYDEELAVLRAAADSEGLLEGLSYIARHAHSRLERDDTPARLGEGGIDPSRFARHLARAGQRTAIPAHHPVRSIASSLPAEAPSTRRIESLDTPANRFAKFVAHSFRERLEAASRSRTALDVPIISWARTTISQLDRILARPPFDRVGRISRVELGDPTLQRKHGYRSILRAYLAARAGLAIRWPELSDIVYAETRDVPHLYELWCLIRLRRAIEAEFGVALSMDHVATSDGTIALRRGSVAVGDSLVTIGGRDYRLRLWYNRTFSPTAATADGRFFLHAATLGTWSKPMKPDYSIELTPIDDGDGSTLSPRFVHFDAKYRLKVLPVNDDGAPERTYAADDIDKMHAYLAGISDSHGAHILYPGDRTAFFRRTGITGSVGAMAAVPGRMEMFGEELRTLLEATFKAGEES
jgi:predicted component of viral defense system (DUF524 family)